MANFSTHLNIAALGGAVVTSFLSLEMNIDTSSAFFCFTATIIGGILPDIDHDNSTPLKIMHFIFSNLIAFIFIYKNIEHLKALEMILVWLVINIIMGIIFYFFKKVTKHRGMIHSIPSGILFWFLTSFILYKFFHFDVKSSYLIGMCLFIGYLIHLILDEIYSVDISGKKLKKSFGSAFKLYSRSNKINLFIYSLLFLIFLLLPQKEIMFNIIKGFINV